MFRRARADDISAKEGEKHLVSNSAKLAEEQLNKRLDSEIEQLMNSFGEILAISKIQNSEGTAIARQRLGASAGMDDDDHPGWRGQSDSQSKDKYSVAQEAYSAQTRVATMVRTIEGLLGMVTDIKRAYLVNDATALTEMATRRRGKLDERRHITEQRVEELNSALDLAVRDLEKVYYSSKYIG
ncbi:hypothetical protein DL89DRAFT_62064 [Linderina pennispora]|uniref:Mediator of RNA polymerase II transcription subunit 22 n=1 Tax=Linderina pennispora TaxID=61395 RepID=A0A1Y1W1G5_9FUNG|nr:uncharacterized protein DL89DRAFT_62064 [Linderina pennispora]ORX66954.1 hypothetical protein DL89DRAFT_62064 [Linderina pennispora]